MLAIVNDAAINMGGQASVCVLGWEQANRQHSSMAFDSFCLQVPALTATVYKSVNCKIK